MGPSSDPRSDPEVPVLTVVSGGQTGVDRAALDAALAWGLPAGGWCPAGRRAEDGPIDARYPLRETPLADYAQRTAWNVRDSDATLLLTWGPAHGGTAFTREEAARLRRPLLHLDLDPGLDLDRDTLPGYVADWLVERRIRVLNVAGPRESEAPGVYARARGLLDLLFERLVTGGRGPRAPGTG